MKAFLSKTLIYITLITIPLFISHGIANAGGQKLIKIKVSAKVYKEIKSWGNDLVFYTPKKKPIKSLNEIKSGKDIAMFGGDLSRPIMQFVDKTLKKDSDGMGIIGGAYWKKLFLKNKLKLFVTHADDDYHKVISKSGGGIQVKFYKK